MPKPNLKKTDPRLEALSFVENWLWKSKDRKTVDCEWSPEYLKDAASMILEYHQSHTPTDPEPGKPPYSITDPKALESLVLWMVEITAVLAYQPDIPQDHKEKLGAAAFNFSQLVGVDLNTLGPYSTPTDVQAPKPKRPRPQARR